MEIISDTIQTANKFYTCDACRQFLNSNYGQADVSADDWLIVQGAEADRWKIRAGQKYRKIVYKDGGFVTYRGRIDMDSLCARNELFEEV